MRIREVMTENAECTRPDATIHQAAKKMKDLDVGVLPVCQGDRLVGMITDRDIVLRGVAEGHDPDRHRVKEAMTPNLFYCFEDEDVANVTKLMKDAQVRRVPVMSRDKRLTGIVSLGDLAVQTHDGELIGEVLEQISEPAMPRRQIT